MAYTAQQTEDFHTGHRELVFFLQKSPPAPSPHTTRVTQIFNSSSQITLPRPQSILLISSRTMGKIWRESRNKMPKARHTIQAEPNQSLEKWKDYSMCLAGFLPAWRMFQGTTIPLIHSQLITHPGSAMPSTATVSHSILPQPMIYVVPPFLSIFCLVENFLPKKGMIFLRNVIKITLVLSSVNLLLLVTSHGL